MPIDYRKALEQEPDTFTARLPLGLNLFKLGQLDEAIGYYRRALEIWPGYPDANVNLGNARFVQGSFDEAIRHYKRALEVDPNNLDAIVSLERNYRRLEMWEQLVEVLSRKAKLAYPIRDDIPVMLEDEARQIPEDEAV